jgi:hypothetical protein
MGPGSDKLTVKFNNGKPDRVFENCNYENDSANLSVYQATGKTVISMSEVDKLNPVKGKDSRSKDWPRESMNESRR